MSELVLQLSGRLTLNEAMQTLAQQTDILKRHAVQPGQDASGVQVIGDLSGLLEVDTSALAVMLHLDRDARAQTGRPISWRMPTTNLVSLARLSSLLEVFSWQDGPPQ